MLQPDKEGFYKLENLKDGIYIIKTSYIGYKTDTDSINISGEKLNINLDFNLNYTDNWKGVK